MSLVPPFCKQPSGWDRSWGLCVRACVRERNCRVALGALLFSEDVTKPDRVGVCFWVCLLLQRHFRCLQPANTPPSGGGDEGKRHMPGNPDSRRRTTRLRPVSCRLLIWHKLFIFIIFLFFYQCYFFFLIWHFFFDKQAAGLPTNVAKRLMSPSSRCHSWQISMF